MIRRILAYILFGSGVLSIIFFGNYAGTLITHVFIFWLIGLLCFLTGWIILRFSPKAKNQRNEKQTRKMITQLKENGEKIKVELAECEIKSNDYSEEHDLSKGGILEGNDIQAWNILLGDEMGSVKTVEIYQSVLIYKQNYKGEDKTFVSGIIPLELTTLLFKLDNQKTTFIYVDRQNSAKYYFDIGFLEV